MINSRVINYVNLIKGVYRMRLSLTWVIIGMLVGFIYIKKKGEW